MLNEIIQRAPMFLLAAVRCFALLMTLPLFSMQNVSRVAKIALAGYMAFFVLPSAYGQTWQLAEYHIAENIFSGAFSFIPRCFLMSLIKDAIALFLFKYASYLCTFVR